MALVVKNPFANAGDVQKMPVQVLGGEDLLEEGMTTLSRVVAMRSRKQTHSEGQCREWSAVYYTRGPKAESPLSQGPQPVFVKTLYTLSVCTKTHLPNFLETSLDKVKERYDQS